MTRGGAALATPLALGLTLGLASGAAARVERWVGVAYSDNGVTPRIVLRGPVQANSDGSVTLSGAYRCLGACLAHHGTVSATLANTADGVGHETVEIDLPDGTICGSDGDLDGAFAVLPPSVGTALSLIYECDDVDGNVLDSGTVDIRRRR
jgi:hypothetical protein